MDTSLISYIVAFSCAAVFAVMLLFWLRAAKTSPVQVAEAESGSCATPDGLDWQTLAPTLVTETCCTRATARRFALFHQTRRRHYALLFWFTQGLYWVVVALNGFVWLRTGEGVYGVLALLGLAAIGFSLVSPLRITWMLRAAATKPQRCAFYSVGIVTGASHLQPEDGAPGNRLPNDVLLPWQRFDAVYECDAFFCLYTHRDQALLLDKHKLTLNSLDILRKLFKSKLHSHFFDFTGK